LFISFTVSSLLYAESRHALLIANGEYKHFAGLKNPVPEANNLAKSLRQLGFEVTVKTNLSRRDMITVLKQFSKTVESDGGIAFIHYGGHAVQINGINYLIPIDAEDDDSLMDADVVELDTVIDSAKGESNIVILDACRNNPYKNSRGSQKRGLVPLSHKPQNSIIVYAAEAGSAARDGVFTPILTEKILEQKSLTEVLRDVRISVKEQTNGRQSPESYDARDNEIYLAGIAPTAEAAELARKTNEYEELQREFSKVKNDLEKKNKDLEKQKKTQPQIIQPEITVNDKYRKRRIIYASVLGVGCGVGCSSVALLSVGAANVADCYSRGLDYGVGVSWGILGVGIGTAVLSLALIPSISVVWFHDAGLNDGLRQNVKKYQSLRLKRRDKALLALGTFSAVAGYIDDKALFGMGIKL
ncbi:MAG: caspase family protein, partial [Spirochaetales bacterium]|nr:caspase family protein [Spirochaetales bacterium]